MMPWTRNSISSEKNWTNLKITHLGTESLYSFSFIWRIMRHLCRNWYIAKSSLVFQIFHYFIPNLPLYSIILSVWPDILQGNY
jgi:hypothetical protein